MALVEYFCMASIYSIIVFMYSLKFYFCFFILFLLHFFFLFLSTTGYSSFFFSSIIFLLWRCMHVKLRQVSIFSSLPQQISSTSTIIWGSDNLNLFFFFYYCRDHRVLLKTGCSCPLLFPHSPPLYVTPLPPFFPSKKKWQAGLPVQ